MPDMTPRDAEAAVERVRSALIAKQLSTDHPQLTVTFSAGLALVMTDESFERCIERADVALCAAKAGGRNRTAVSRGAAPANIGAVAAIPQTTERGKGHSAVSPTSA